MLYLNHAGTSWPKPKPVRQAVAEAMRADPEAWPGTFAAHHKEVARALHIAEPDRLLLTPGCTAALSVAISDHDWQPGDRIVTSGLEHHALLRPVLALRSRGVEHVIVPPDGASPFDLARLEAVLRAGPVRLIAVCAAANVSGALLPIHELIQLGHEHGSLVLLDAAQIAGWMRLDVAQLGVDLLAFAGHKGPQAPWGVGGLYVAPHVAMHSPRARLDGSGAALQADAFAEAPGYCDTGSVDRAALAGLVAGLHWLDAPAQRARLAHARQLVAHMAETLRQHPGVELLGPAAPRARMPTLAFTLAGHKASDVARALRAEGIIASGGLQCARLAHETLGTAPDGVVRLSAGPRTPSHAPAQLAEAMTRMARHLS